MNETHQAASQRIRYMSACTELLKRSWNWHRQELRTASFQNKNITCESLWKTVRTSCTRTSWLISKSLRKFLVVSIHVDSCWFASITMIPSKHVQIHGFCMVLRCVLHDKWSSPLLILPVCSGSIVPPLEVGNNSALLVLSCCSEIVTG